MPPVTEYIANAPADQRPTLERLRQMIRAALPDCTEQIGSSGFPVYTRDGDWIAGFATRKKGPMLYIMAPGVLDEFEERLGPLRSGNSCVEFRATKTVSEADLWRMTEEMLARGRADESA